MRAHSRPLRRRLGRQLLPAGLRSGFERRSGGRDDAPFKQTLLVPGGNSFFRGIAYGGGSLWLSDVSAGNV